MCWWLLISCIRKSNLNENLVMMRIKTCCAEYQLPRVITGQLFFRKLGLHASYGSIQRRMDFL